MTIVVLLGCATAHQTTSERTKDTTDKSQTKRHSLNGYKHIGHVEHDGQASANQRQMGFYAYPVSGRQQSRYSELQSLDKSYDNTSPRQGYAEPIYSQDYESESSDYDYNEYRGPVPYGRPNDRGDGYGHHDGYGGGYNDNDYQGNGYGYHYYYPGRGYTYGYHYHQPYVSYYHPYGYQHQYYEPYTYSYRHSYK